MKRLILLVMAFILTVTMAACGGSNSGNSEKTGSDSSKSTSSDKTDDTASNSDVESNKAYINDNSNCSKNKLAFLLTGERVNYVPTKIILTVDSDVLDNSDFSWTEGGIKNKTVEINEFDFIYFDFLMNISDLSLSFDSDYSISDSNPILAKDGDWLLKKGNIDQCYTAYFNFDTKEDGNCMEISLYRVPSVEKAKEIYNKCKSMLNVYIVQNDDYLHPVTNKNKKVDLSDYAFYNDIVAKLLAKDNLNVSSQYITEVNDQRVIVKVPFKDDFIEYVLEPRLENYSGSAKIQDTFKLNGSKVKLIESYNDKSRNYYVKSGDRNIAVFGDLPSNIENPTTKMHKKYFISTFK